MANKRDEVIEKIAELRSKDISHDEFGTVNGFHAAEDAKNRVCNLGQVLIDKAKVHESAISDMVLEGGFDLIQNTLNTVDSHIQSEDSAEANG